MAAKKSGKKGTKKGAKKKVAKKGKKKAAKKKAPKKKKAPLARIKRLFCFYYIAYSIHFKNVKFKKLRNVNIYVFT